MVELINQICRYTAKMKCQVTFKLGSGCKKMEFHCPSETMDLPSNKKCKKGDILRVGSKR